MNAYMMIWWGWRAGCRAHKINFSNHQQQHTRKKIAHTPTPTLNMRQEMMQTLYWWPFRWDLTVFTLFTTIFIHPVEKKNTTHTHTHTIFIPNYAHGEHTHTPKATTKNTPNQIANEIHKVWCKRNQLLFPLSISSQQWCHSAVLMRFRRTSASISLFWNIHCDCDFHTFLAACYNLCTI